MAAAWPGRKSDDEIDTLAGEGPKASNSEDTEETKGARMTPKLDQLKHKQEAVNKAAPTTRLKQ